MSSVFKKIFLLAAASVFAFTGLALADDKSGDDVWYYEITPYVAIPSLDGDSTVEGQTVGVDLSIGDVLDAVDFAASIRGELWRNDWGFILDYYYANLGEAQENQAVAVDVDIRQGIFDTLVAYRAVGSTANVRNREGFIIDLMSGVRWNYLKQEVDLSTAPPFLPDPNLGGSEYFAELFLGARFGIALNEWLSGVIRGGASGFGIGSGSDLTWEMLVGLDAAFHERWSARLGVRHYDIDYSKGGGTDEFGMDVTQTGPYLAVNYRGDFS